MAIPEAIRLREKQMGSVPRREILRRRPISDRYTIIGRVLFDGTNRVLYDSVLYFDPLTGVTPMSSASDDGR